MLQKILLNANEIDIILHRLACQLVENHGDFSNTILIGLQPRGSFVSKRLLEILEKEHNLKTISNGILDITFYRDDFRRREEPLEANATNVPSNIENRNVVIIDDVLFSGRSIRAALTALQSFGRPSKIELLVLIDRRFSRHLPIQPNYRGRQVDVINNEKVAVQWKETEGEDIVHIITK